MSRSRPIAAIGARSAAPDGAQGDWTRTPAAICASAALGLVAILALGWSWNRTLTLDARRGAFEAALMADGPARLSGAGESSSARMAQESAAPRGTLSAIRLIDPNSAGGAELELLPGIGPALAGRIIEDRGLKGPFASIDDLQRVKGIGPKTVEKLRPHLRIDATSDRPTDAPTDEPIDAPETIRASASADG